LFFKAEPEQGECCIPPHIKKKQYHAVSTGHLELAKNISSLNYLLLGQKRISVFLEMWIKVMSYWIFFRAQKMHWPRTVIHFA
jgi:hypothetical protein